MLLCRQSYCKRFLSSTPALLSPSDWSPITFFFFCFGTPEKLCHSFPGRTCGQLGCHSTLIVMSNIHIARRDQCWYLIIVPFLKNAEAQSDNQFGTSFLKKIQRTRWINHRIHLRFRVNYFGNQALFFFFVRPCGSRWKWLFERVGNNVNGK